MDERCTDAHIPEYLKKVHHNNDEVYIDVIIYCNNRGDSNGK